MLVNAADVNLGKRAVGFHILFDFRRLSLRLAFDQILQRFAELNASLVKVCFKFLNLLECFNLKLRSNAKLTYMNLQNVIHKYLL